MKEIITEYGKTVMLFVIGGLIMLIVAWFALWGKDLMAKSVYAKEELIKYESNEEFREIINSEVDISVANNLNSNRIYNIHEVILGADDITVIKVENPELVRIEGDNITFLKGGVISMYIEARNAEGVFSRNWLAIGVDGMS